MIASIGDPPRYYQKCDVCDVVFGIDLKTGDATNEQPVMSMVGVDGKKQDLCRECYWRGMLYAARAARAEVSQR